MVALLSHAELSRAQLRAALGVDDRELKEHIESLLDGGIIDERREGKLSVSYTLRHQDDAHCRRYLRALANSFRQREAISAQVAELRHGLPADPS